MIKPKGGKAEQMYTFEFSCHDNGGKRQYFKVKANSKDQAIKKGLEKAKKNAAGDIGFNWECKLLMMF